MASPLHRHKPHAMFARKIQRFSSEREISRGNEENFSGRRFCYCPAGKRQKGCACAGKWEIQINLKSFQGGWGKISTVDVFQLHFDLFRK